MLLFPATVAASVIVAVILEGGTTNATLARRRIALLLTTAAYGGALAGVWPVISREDYLPFYPMLAITVAAVLLALGRRHGRSAVMIVLAVEMVFFVGDVLQLTRADDPVFDYKGESIFRARPFFWVFELLTKTRLDRGFIADTVPETLVATATHVAVHDSNDLSPRTRRFLDDHYVSVGRLRVAGQRVACANGSSSAADAGERDADPRAVASPGAVAADLECHRIRTVAEDAARRRKVNVVPRTRDRQRGRLPAVDRHADGCAAVARMLGAACLERDSQRRADRRSGDGELPLRRRVYIDWRRGIVFSCDGRAAQGGVVDRRWQRQP